MNPREWRQSVEKRLNDLLDRAMSLITALDLMEADCDLEDTADDEPSPGWCERGPQTVSAAFLDGRGSPYDDREQDNCDDEDTHDAEPDQCDGEPVTWETDQSQEVLVSL